MPSMRSTRPVKGIQGSDCQTVQHIIIGPGVLWVIGQDVLEAAFFLLAVRSLGKCRLLRGGRWGLGYQMVMMLSHAANSLMAEAEGA